MFYSLAKIFLCFVVLFSPLLSTVQASAEVMTPDIFIREIKIKGEDFMVLQAQKTVQLGEYYLSYSSDPTEPPVPEFQLADGSLRAGQAAVLVNDDTVPTCDAVLAMDIPMDLAETKGRVTLWHEVRSQDGKTLTYEDVDTVTWSNAKTGLFDILRPMTVEDGLLTPTWFRGGVLNGEMTWNVGDLQTNDVGRCILATKAGIVLSELVSTDSEPPAVIDQQNGSTAAENGTSADENDGLVAPQITELVPNPAGSGTDGTDEFIELYNANDATYNLSGYVLQTGLSTKHNYIFPAGTVLTPNSFSAFYSSQTGLSMSNSGGQATLLSPDGVILSQSDPYGVAADGKAWALADGAWYWSITATANQANVITENVVAAVLSATKTAAKVTTAKVKKAATAKAPKATTVKKKSTKQSSSASNTKKVASAATEPVRSIHPAVLALVAAAAVGYGLYEYRHDVANRFHKFRTNRAARRSHRG